MNDSNITLDTPLVVCWYDTGYYNNDDDYGGYSDGYVVKDTTITELYNEIKNNRSFETNYEPIYNDGVDALVDFIDDKDYQVASARGLVAYEAGVHGSLVKDVVNYINDGDQGYLQTLDSYNAVLAEKERIKMEQLATKYAKIWKVTAGSYNFIQLLRSYKNDLIAQQDKYNNYENRAERWAAHMYYGNTHEYFNDEQYGNNNFHSSLNEIESIENWLYQYCPLLMASLEEKEFSNTH